MDRSRTRLLSTLALGGLAGFLALARPGESPVNLRVLQEAVTRQPTSQTTTSPIKFVSVNAKSIRDVHKCPDFWNSGSDKVEGTIDYRIVPMPELTRFARLSLGYEIINPVDFRRIETDFIKEKEKIERTYIGKPLAIIGKFIEIVAGDNYVQGIPNEPLAQGFTNYFVTVRIRDPTDPNRTVQGRINFLDRKSARDTLLTRLNEDMTTSENPEIALYGTVEKKDWMNKGIEYDGGRLGPVKLNRVRYWTELEFHGAEVLSSKKETAKN